MTSQRFMGGEDAGSIVGGDPSGVPCPSPADKRIINPFIHELRFTNWHRFKIFLGAIMLLPFRILMVLIFLSLASLLANISLCIMSVFKLSARRRQKCRQFLKPPCIFLLRSMFFLGGFFRPRILDENGKKVSKDSIEAPIICLAPHSSLFDVLSYIMLGAPAVVAKNEAKFTPLIGSVLLLSDPILVVRESKVSRSETIRAIRNKAMNEKILIFPEGTCTNRSSLIQFKLGAFLPGLPVQPVAIRYYIQPEEDDITWTWDGPGAIKLLLFSLCRWKTDVDVIILPSYYPTAQEKQDPQLFASNVRNVIANYLHIPTSFYSYDDVRFLNFVSEWQIPRSPACLKLVKLCHRIISKEYNRKMSDHGCELPTGQTSSSFNGAANGLISIPSFSSTASLVSASSSQAPMSSRSIVVDDHLRLRNSPDHEQAKDNNKQDGHLRSDRRRKSREESSKSDSELENKDGLSELTLNDLVEFINKLAQDISMLPQSSQIKSRDDLIHILRIAHCSKIGTSTSVNELYLCLNNGGQMPIRAKDLLILCTLCDARIESLWDRIEKAFEIMSNNSDEKIFIADRRRMPHRTSPIINPYQFKQLIWFLLGYSDLSEQMLSHLSQEPLTFERMRQIFLCDFADLIRQNSPYLLTANQATSILTIDQKQEEQAKTGSNSTSVANLGHDNLAFNPHEGSHETHLHRNNPTSHQSSHFTQVMI